MNQSFNDVSVGSQEFNDRCSSIINEIKNGNGTVLNLVENLQSLLTNTSNEERIKGITVLSTVLDSVPDSLIPTNEIGVLANFLCDRLRDHHQVVPAVIKALLIVINKGNLTKDTAKRILSGIFEHIPVQPQQRIDRNNIYCIFKTLHQTSKNEIREMGLDLIYGIITAIDGEQDPRNLKFLFEWLEEFLQDFELGHLSEDMFEVLACYFPVDFKPSSEEAITRNSLAKSLARCLCATKKFGDFIVPLALEKLDSELISAKIDSLEILDLTSQKFPPDLLMKYSTAIWAPIHKEILTAQDENLQLLAVKTFASFVRCITTNSNSDVSSLLQSMLLNVKGNATPDSKLFNPSCKIIFSMASSKLAAEYVVETMVPLWINLYNITTTPKHQADILKVLCELTIIAIESNLTFDDNKYLQNVPGLFLRALTELDNDLKSESLRCFQKIACYLPKESRKVFFENLKLLILVPLEYEQRTLVLCCFKEYAKYYPVEIENLIKSLKTDHELNLYLEAIGSVLEIKQLWPLCAKELITHATENSKEIFPLPLNILSKILVKPENFELAKYLFEKENVVFKLTDWFIIHSKQFNTDIDSVTLDDISKILYGVIARLDSETQQIILEQITEKIKFKPVEEMFVIWYGVLVGLRNVQTFDTEMYNKFFDTVIHTRSSYTNEILSQLLGNLFNKTDDDNFLDRILSDIESQILISSENCNNRNIFNILSFTTKGLVLRGHSNAVVWTNKLLQISSQHKEACKSIQIILDDTYTCFSRFCYIKERLLYKQKFFSDVINYINANCKPEDTNYLSIVAYLVQGIPESLLHMHLLKVIKWILLYLDVSDDNVTICNLCKIINRAVQSNVTDVFRYTSEILKVYLKLAMKNPSMKVRIEALKGIRLFSQLPTHEIINQKQDVIKNLNVCVDDHKRLVRKEAMETRLKWYLIDSPI